jgi:hypothetical protein
MGEQVDLLDTSQGAGVGQPAAGVDDDPLDPPPVEQLRQGTEHARARSISGRLYAGL